MEKIKNTLKNIGLNKTEIEVYLSALNYESIDVARLVKLTNVKRTTIYHTLNSLSQKGLASKKEQEGKLSYTMTEPEKLLNLVKREKSELELRERELEEIIPLLDIKKERASDDFEVFHYEGIEGIKTVVDDALYCESGHWDIIAPLKNFFSDFDKNYAGYFIEKRKRRGITARSLWERDPSRRILAKDEIKQRRPRYLPKEMHGRFKSVVIIYDEKVAFISSFEKLSAIIISSKEINDVMQIMFDGLWFSSSDN